MTSDDDFKQAAPSEFSEFVRRIGIRAFDQFAERKLESTQSAASGDSRKSRLQKLASLWIKLPPEEKERFFDQVIAAGQAVAAAAPMVIAIAKTKRAERKAATPSEETRIGETKAPEPETGKVKKAKKKDAKKDTGEKKTKKASKKKGKKDHEKRD